MSHSQFHCTARVHLHMHGLIFETSICYWQDQPGSRAPGHRPTPARRLSAGKGAHRERPTPAAPPASPDRPGKERRPLRSFRRRARRAHSLTRCSLLSLAHAREPDGGTRGAAAAAPAGADPPPKAGRPTGGDAPGTAPAAAAGATDVLEENATPRRARAPATGAPTTPGGGALRSGRGTRPPKARTLPRRPRRGGGTPPHPAHGRRDAPRGSLSLARPRCFWHIVCGHPRRLAARGRHPPGPGPRTAPAPRTTLTDPCGSRGRSAVTQPASAGKAPSIGDENDGRSADRRPGHAP